MKHSRASLPGGFTAYNKLCSVLYQNGLSDTVSLIYTAPERG
jgi:hypothetical protein